MANPIALPGTNVPSGAAVSPGGAQGPSAVSANANNKATLGSDSLVLVQGTAAGVAATTHAQTVSGDDPQLTTLASASTKGLLNQTSGNTTDFIDGTNNSQALQPVIWSATRRVFQAIGNPTFEVDQRNVGNSVTNPGGGTLIIDRWMKGGNGTYQVLCSQVAFGNIVVPGTNYIITSKTFYTQLTAAQATLGATDRLGIRTQIEGVVMRELQKDVHSVSLLVYSTVAPLSFSLALYDTPLTRSLVKLCTIPTASTWTLIQLPNIPVWAAGGNWSVLPGVIGYNLEICLAAGSSVTAPAADVWQNGQFQGAPGMSNFCASTPAAFYVAFVQHEPGALCTTLQDCPWQQNYDACLRYYTKSYGYAVKPGTVDQNGSHAGMNQANQPPLYWHLPFKKVMAKIPTVTGYSSATGAINNLRNLTAGADLAITAANNVADSAFSGFNIASPPTGLWVHQVHYTGDSGW